eukprot:47503-Pelagomonas_calceolata.AAC.1
MVMVAGSTMGACSFTGWLIHGGSHKSGYYFLWKGADSLCGWHINGLVSFCVTGWFGCVVLELGGLAVGA